MQVMDRATDNINRAADNLENGPSRPRRREQHAPLPAERAGEPASDRLKDSSASKRWPRRQDVEELKSPRRRHQEDGADMSRSSQVREGQCRVIRLAKKAMTRHARR
jgi:hypothetical protein